MDALQQVKINVLEHRIPFFDDEEILYYLNQNNGDVRKTTYDCLIRKAEVTGLDVSGLTTKDSSSFFKMLASQYVTTNTGVLKC